MEKGFDYTFEYFKKIFVENEREITINSSKQWSDDAWFLDQENRDFIDNQGMFIINEGEAERKNYWWKFMYFKFASRNRIYARY